MLLTERRNAILALTLNRPEKRNALHPELVTTLSESLKAAAEEDSINVVLITGAGKAFCAGLDLEHTLGLVEARNETGVKTEGRCEGTANPPAQLEAVFALFQRLFILPQPVIAAINGPAIAGGFDLAQFCDLRLCVPEAVFSQAEINLGLTQMIYPLYKIIGLARAKEWAMTGALISAEEAYRAGFINHIYPADELLPRAFALAETLAAKPRQALFETKRLSRELIEMDSQPAFARMGAAIRERLQSQEHRQVSQDYVARLKTRNE